MRDSGENLAEIGVNSIHCFSLIHQVSHVIIRGYQVVQTLLCLRRFFLPITVGGDCEWPHSDTGQFHQHSQVP